MISHRAGVAAADGASTAGGGDVLLAVSDVAVSDAAVSDAAVSDAAVFDEAASDEAGDGESPVNFDEAALVELELDGTDYRLDAGRAGTALCISTRRSGTWSWVFRGEARWQANVLKCKAFDRSVLLPLGKALAEAAAATD